MLNTPQGSYMSKKFAKRLSLGSETIRALSSASLDTVVGGADQRRSLPPSVIDGCPSTPLQCPTQRSR